MDSISPQRAVQLLLDHGATFTSAAHKAAYCASVESLQKELGPDGSPLDDLIFLFAAASGDVSILHILLARVQKPLPVGSGSILARAARVAVRSGHLSWLRSLLDALRETGDQTTEAAPEVYRCLLSRALDLSLHDAVEAGRLDIVKWLASQGTSLPFQ
jgi:hypothetical protein